MPEELRTKDGHPAVELMYLTDGKSLFKLSTLYEREATLQVCLDAGELTERTIVRHYSAERVRHLYGQGAELDQLVTRYETLLAQGNAGRAGEGYL